LQFCPEQCVSAYDVSLSDTGSSSEDRGCVDWGQFVNCASKAIGFDTQQPVLDEPMRAQRMNLRNEEWKRVLFVDLMHIERHDVQSSSPNIHQCVQATLPLR